jgi:hypothetical protein
MGEFKSLMLGYNDSRTVFEDEIAGMVSLDEMSQMRIATFVVCPRCAPSVARCGDDLRRGSWPHPSTCEQGPLLELRNLSFMHRVASRAGAWGPTV